MTASRTTEPAMTNLSCAGRIVRDTIGLGILGWLLTDPVHLPVSYVYFFILLAGFYSGMTAILGRDPITNIFTVLRESEQERIPGRKPDTRM